MPIRRIFGYIGFVISLPIAFYFVKISNSVGIGMIGLDTICDGKIIKYQHETKKILVERGSFI
jgi:hypothetical protein